MTKGKPLDVIAVPRGELAQSMCETCPNVQTLNVNKSAVLVCVNKRCRLFKKIMEGRK